MKRLLSLFTAACLTAAVLLLSVSCLGGGGAGDFTDDSGRTVRLPSRPKRVAVLFSSLAELWTLAGGQVAVTVGESVERGIVPDGTPLVDAGAGKTVSIEALIASEADLIIGSADVPAQVEALERMQALGTVGILLHLESFSDYLRILSLFTSLTGDTDAYARLGTPLAEEVSRILASTEGKTGPRILFLRAGASQSSVKAKRSRDHFAAEMLRELGCVNIADSAPILLDGLSLEVILEQAPDLILVSTMGDEAAAIENVSRMLASPAWSTLDAVRRGRVIFLEKELFQYKPNDAWADAYRLLSELIYGNDETP